jgi:DNA-binding HxlR family transcriptional regulator
VAKSYDQYCPVAHALDLVGERWSLLVVRELLEEGPLRYSDLHARLEGCGTNILAARLKTLEQGGVIRRRQLDPPAASWIYELTEYGQGLRAVLHQLAHWGARSLGPPTSVDDLEPGWLSGALRIAVPETCTDTRIEFRIGDEVAALDGRGVCPGSIDDPHAVVVGDATGFYRLFVDREADGVSIEGDASAVHAMLETLPPVRQGSEPAAAR